MKKQYLVIVGVMLITFLNVSTTFGFRSNEIIKNLNSEVDSISNKIELKENADSLSFHYSNKIDKLLVDWYSQLPYSDNINFETSADTAYINLPDSIYIQRLQSIDSYIPLSYNAAVKKMIDFYASRVRKKAELFIGSSNYYFPIFEEVLDKYQLPIELKYLAVIESALIPNITSRAGACGLWQFIISTGKLYGLEINTLVDERRNPLKSTDAAARYLSDLYKIYGDWHMVIAAYNCGPGNVNKAIRRAGGKADYWAIYPYLPRETREYVPSFIAATYIFNYYKELNITPKTPELTFATDTFHVTQSLNLDHLAKTLDVDPSMLSLLNPMYKKRIIPGKPSKPYLLLLPIDKSSVYIDNEHKLYATQQEKSLNAMIVEPSTKTVAAVPTDIKGKDRIYYTVKQGDNPGFIASWFGIKTSDLIAWNNIRRNMIQINDKLVIYVPKGKASHFSKFDEMSFDEKQNSIGSSASIATPTPTKVTNTTISSTASANSSSQLITKTNFDLNNIGSTIGDDVEYIYHKVRQGDSLWEIAKLYPGASSEEIKRINKITNTRGLTVGQLLKIKPKA